MWVVLPEPESTADALSAWPGLDEQFPQVIGFSRFGHVLLAAPATSTFGILDPDGGSLGTFADYADASTFIEQVINHTELNEGLMPAALVEAVTSRIGPVEDSTVYIPVPYRFLGGDGDPQTYSSGDVWVYLHLTGQFLNGASE